MTWNRFFPQSIPNSKLQLLSYLGISPFGPFQLISRSAKDVLHRVDASLPISCALCLAGLDTTGHNSSLLTSDVFLHRMRLRRIPRVI